MPIKNRQSRTAYSSATGGSARGGEKPLRLKRQGALASMAKGGAGRVWQPTAACKLALRARRDFGRIFAVGKQARPHFGVRVAGLTFTLLTAVLGRQVCRAEAQPDWWKHSALASGPASPSWQWHVEGRLSYGETDGNTKAYYNDGAFRLAIRRDVLTSLTEAHLRRRRSVDVVDGGKPVRGDQRLFEQAIVTDLTARLSIKTGAQWSSDRSMYIDDRRSLYAGLLCNAWRGDRSYVYLGLFGGRDTTRFMNRELADILPTLVTEPYASGVALATASLHWAPNDTVTFIESFDYMIYLNDQEYYRWNMNLGMYVKATRHASLFVTYSVSYDDNALTEKARAIGYRLRDTTLTTGIKFQY